MFTIWWLIENWASEWSGQVPFKPDISFKDKNLTTELSNQFKTSQDTSSDLFPYQQETLCITKRH